MVVFVVVVFVPSFVVVLHVIGVPLVVFFGGMLVLAVHCVLF